MAMMSVMSVPKRILCPIDFDEYSGRALAWAQNLARRHGAELLLLHVFPLRPAVLAQGDRAGHTRLDELAAIIRASGVPCEVTTLNGDPAFHILQAARDGEADLVVMATHGRKGMPRVLLGSVTEAVLHATPSPLLTIPPRAADADGSFRRVLCAVDFCPSSAGTLSHALAMVQVGSGELTVVNVVDPSIASRSPADAGADIEVSLERLHRRIPDEVAHWCVLRNAVRFGDTAAEVLKLAAEAGADLIVVGAHSRRPAVAAIVGSCADRIVREAPCPVLAVPSPAQPLTAPGLYPVYA